jgi:hypothetical protein
MRRFSWRYRALGGVDIRVLYQSNLSELLNHPDRGEGGLGKQLGLQVGLSHLYACSDETSCLDEHS